MKGYKPRVDDLFDDKALKFWEFYPHEAKKFRSTIERFKRKISFFNQEPPKPKEKPIVPLSEPVYSGPLQRVLCQSYLLSIREAEIAEYIAKAMTNLEIAVHFELTEKTVKFHATNIYQKIGISSRAELVYLCGIIERDLKCETSPQK